MGAIGKVRNMWRQLAGQAIAAVAVAALLGSIGLFAPGPVVDHFLENDIRADAQRWKERLLAELNTGPAAFTVGRIAPDDSDFLKMVPKTSDIFDLSLIGRNGVYFWSTDTMRIGTAHVDPHLERVIQTGEINYEVMAEEPDAQDPHFYSGPATGSDPNHYIAEVDVPIVKAGKVVGVFEYFRDITQTRAIFVQRVHLLLWALMTLIGLLFLAISAAMLRAHRMNARRLHAQAEHDHRIMDDQIRLSREVRLLGELNEWLQSSRSLEELFEMVARFMTHLLPSGEGSVYVYSNSRDALDGCASWNGGQHKDHIHPEECWGLRRGRTYAFGATEVDFPCAHAEPHDGRAYVCFPILAHGETVGLMHLRACAGVVPEEFQASRRLAQLCAEQISMAIANVRMRDQLQDQSIRDPLTGLYNRRHLTESLRRQMARLAKAGGSVAIISVDVDHFKKFNDNHGHDAGDMVLRAVGSAFSKFCDGDEPACRIGGEEFMLLMPESDAARTLERAERLRRDIEAVIVRYGEKTLPRITISAGVAVGPEHGTLPQDLMRIADDALYEAKARGRNQVVLARLPGTGPDSLPGAGQEPAGATERARQQDALSGEGELAAAWRDETDSAAPADQDGRYHEDGMATRAAEDPKDIAAE